MSVVDKIDKILDEAKKISFEDALTKLKKTGDLSTGILAPLGITMNSFLKFSQLPDAKRKSLVAKMIKGFDQFTSKEYIGKSVAARMEMWKKIKNEDADFNFLVLPIDEKTNVATAISKAKQRFHSFMERAYGKDGEWNESKFAQLINNRTKATKDANKLFYWYEILTDENWHDLAKMAERKYVKMTGEPINDHPNWGEGFPW